jgi:hypothetical protein
MKLVNNELVDNESANSEPANDEPTDDELADPMPTPYGVTSSPCIEIPLLVST